MSENEIVKHPTRKDQVIPKSLLDTELPPEEKASRIQEFRQVLTSRAEELKRKGTLLTGAALVIANLVDPIAAGATSSHEAGPLPADKNTLISPTATALTPEPWLQTTGSERSPTQTPTPTPERSSGKSVIRTQVEFTVVDEPVNKLPNQPEQLQEAAPRPDDALYLQQGWDKQLHINRDFNPLVDEQGNTLRRTKVNIVTFGFGAPDPSSSYVAREVTVAPENQYNTFFITENSITDDTQISSAGLQFLAARSNNGTDGWYWDSGGSSIIGPINGVEEDTKTKLITFSVNEGTYIVNRRVENGLNQLETLFAQEIAAGNLEPYVLLLPNVPDSEDRGCQAAINRLRAAGQAAGKRIIVIVHAFGGASITGNIAEYADMTVGGFVMNSDGTGISSLIGSTGQEDFLAPGQKPTVRYAGGSHTIYTNFAAQPGSLIAGIVAEALQINPNLTPSQIVQTMWNTAFPYKYGPSFFLIPNHAAAREVFKSTLNGQPTPTLTATPEQPTATATSTPVHPTETPTSSPPNQNIIHIPLVDKP